MPHRPTHGAGGRRRRLAWTVTLVVVVGIVALIPAVAAAAADTVVAERSGNTLLKVLGSIGVGATIVLLAVLIFIPDPAVEHHVRSRLGAYGVGDPAAAQAGGRFSFLKRLTSSAERVAERRGVREVIESALEQADIPIRAGEAIAASLGLAGLVGVLVALFTSDAFFGVLGLAGTLALLGLAIQIVATRERKRFEQQLPDTLNLMATSLRAGYSLLQALEAVASEAPSPTGREYGRALSEIRLGRAPTEALNDIAKRMVSVDFDWVALAIDIQREVGGNLAEVLQTSAETMLQRNRLRREIRALTAEGRISAFVLGLLPFAVFGFMWFTNPTYLEPLFEEFWGIAALVGSGVLMIVGITWLVRIVKVDI